MEIIQSYTMVVLTDKIANYKMIKNKLSTKKVILIKTLKPLKTTKILRNINIKKNGKQPLS